MDLEIDLKVCLPENGFSVISSNNEFGFLKDVIKEILGKFKIGYPDCTFNKNNGNHLLPEFVWVDLAALFTNETSKPIEKLLPEIDFVNKTSSKPRIFIGSQSIEDILNSGVNINFKRLTQLDNNIWGYYINIQEKESFKKQLEYILQEICFNYRNNLYNLQVSHEYLDYFRRLCSQNYLTGGHSSQVIPQVYTSKTLLKGFIKNNLNNETRSGALELLTANTPTLGELSIKVLLVDDFVGKSMTKWNKSSSSNDGEQNQKKDENCTKNKQKILESLWDFYMQQPLLKKIKINLDITTTDKPEVQAGYYDIVLLDYNFNNEKNGIDYLIQLKENAEKNLSKDRTITGPFDKVWIIPISSFSNAFMEEMRNRNIGFISSYYELSAGADFINTPYLFFTYFIRMVKEIITKAITTKNSLNEYFKILEDLKNAKDWSDIKGLDYQELFRNHIKHKNDFESFIESKEGIIAGIKGNEGLQKLGPKQLNFYEQLLYNLAYRNYAGNEEILIFYDLLDKSLKES